MTEHRDLQDKPDDLSVDPRQAAMHARLDGERDTSGSVDSDVALASDVALRADLDAYTLLDRDLRDAFASRRARAEANAVAVIERLQLHAARRPSARPAGRILGYVAGLVTATAAGFALALLVFPPTTASAGKFPITNASDHTNTENDNAPHVGGNANSPASANTAGSSGVAVARLALVARDGVSLWDVDIDTDGIPDDEDTWTAIPLGATVPTGAWVRAAGPCCFMTTDGSEIRLNANTQMRLLGARETQLQSGQIYALVAPSDSTPFRIRAGDAVVTALGTQFDLSATASTVRLAVLEGATRIDAVGEERHVGAGEEVTLRDGRLGNVQAARDLLLATRWVNEILVMKGRDDPELNARIDAIFSLIGHDKLKYLYEEEIRALGDHCVLPLCRYLESEQSHEEPELRLKAARILSDIAAPWAIPDLIELLRHDDGEVRALIAEGLTRLTGHTMGREPTAWSDPWSACEPTYDHWVKWWQENQAKVPGSRSWIDD